MAAAMDTDSAVCCSEYEFDDPLILLAVVDMISIDMIIPLAVQMTEKSSSSSVKLPSAACRLCASCTTRLRPEAPSLALPPRNLRMILTTMMRPAPPLSASAPARASSAVMMRRFELLSLSVFVGYLTWHTSLECYTHTLHVRM